MFRRFASEQQRFAASGRAARRPLVQVEVAFYFATFLSEQERQEEARSKPAPEPCEQSRARGCTEPLWRMPELGEQLGPDLDVAILDDGEARVHVAFFGVGFHARQRSIQERGVGLVLPVVLERVDVGRGRKRHVGKYARVGRERGTRERELGTGNWERGTGNTGLRAACFCSELRLLELMADG